MNPEIKYYYANFLCKDVDQYIRIIAPVYADIDKQKTNDFWEEHKLISDRRPVARWNRNQKIKEKK